MTLPTPAPHHPRTRFVRPRLSLLSVGLIAIAPSWSAWAAPTTAGATATPPAKAASSLTPLPSSDPTRAHGPTVVIERGKRPIALGVLLSERNVIVTARSPLVTGGDGELEVRFPDSGTSTKARIHHENEAWDLAMLVPASAPAGKGAEPSESDPLSPTASFSSFVLLRNGHVQTQPTAVLGRRDYLAPDGSVLKDALSIETKNVAIGTPLVDAAGAVAALVVRACAPGATKPTAPGKATCQATLVGVPLSGLLAFTRSAPAIKTPTPWLGLSGLTDRTGVRVVQVQEGSPAHVAGLRAGEANSGDVLLAVDGTLLKNAEDLVTQVKRHAPGDELKLLVARNGVVREVKVTLKSAEDIPATAKPSAASSSPPASILLPLPPMPPMPPLAGSVGRKP